jgi:hypothetical protein
MKSFALVLVAALSMAAPALAADTPSTDKAPATATPAKPAADKKAKTEEKLICTRETSTDSFLSKRVCRTQEQIDADRRAAQRFEDDRQLLGSRPDQRR